MQRVGQEHNTHIEFLRDTANPSERARVYKNEGRSMIHDDLDFSIYKDADTPPSPKQSA